MLRYCIALIMSCHHSEVPFFNQAVTVYLFSPLQQTPLALLSVSLLFLSVLQVVITYSHFMQLHRHEPSVSFYHVYLRWLLHGTSVILSVGSFPSLSFCPSGLCTGLQPACSVVLFCQALYLFRVAVSFASLSFICGY